MHFIVLYIGLQVHDHARYAQVRSFVMANWCAKREKQSCDNFQPGKEQFGNFRS